jgi:hypothetical protein
VCVWPSTSAGSLLLWPVCPPVGVESYDYGARE